MELAAPEWSSMCSLETSSQYTDDHLSSVVGKTEPDGV